MGTQSGSTAKAIEALDKEIDSMAKGGVTETELKKGKDAILNSFIFEFDSKDKVLAERMRYEFYGYPQNFLELFRAGIEKVTPADVDRVAKKYLHRDKMAILVVGNSKDFDRDLKTFGNVIPVDIAIPQKKPAFNAMLLKAQKKGGPVTVRLLVLRELARNARGMRVGVF